MKRIGLWGLVFFATLALTAWGQVQTGGTSQQETVEKVPIKYTSPSSGKEMYMSYCAACHGENGKGDGPAASALKEPPPDLTALAKNNGGKYPGARVSAVLRFGVKAPAHGAADMPIWGPLLSSFHLGGESVDMRITALTNYIKALQSK